MTTGEHESQLAQAANHLRGRPFMIIYYPKDDKEPRIVVEGIKRSRLPLMLAKALGVTAEEALIALREEEDDGSKDKEK